MQLLSPGTVLAAIAASRQHGSSSAFPLESFLHPSRAILIMILAGQAAGLLGIWLGSRMAVQREKATFPNALKVWVCNFLVMFGAGACLALALPFVIASGDPIRIALVQWGVLVLGLLLTCLIPMKVYVAGFPQALTILIIAALANAIVIAALHFTMFKGAGLERQAAWFQDQFSTTSGKQSRANAKAEAKVAADRVESDEINRLLNAALHPVGPTPSLQEHEAMVGVLQQKLETRRRSLPPGNANAQAAYQNQLNRYMLFLDQVKTERRLRPTATPVH